MSKERYYYRGHWDDDGLFYTILKVTEDIKNRNPSLRYFDTPEECMAYCEKRNHNELEHTKEKFAIYLRSSLNRIKNGESS